MTTCSFPFTHWALERLGGLETTRVFVTRNGDWPARSDASEYKTFSTDLLVCTNPDYLNDNRQRRNCALIPNGVNLEHFSPGPAERATLGLPQTGRIVLMFSAFIESERVADGIRAVARLPDCHLVVAGDGPMRDTTEQFAQGEMPGRFHQITLPPEKMPALYRSADAFLHMSLLESFGNVFLEAWARGLPVVAHDTPRLRWILGDSGGFLCNTQDDDALVSMLGRALAEAPISSAGDLQRFAWPTIAGQYREAIRNTKARVQSGLAA